VSSGRKGKIKRNVAEAKRKMAEATLKRREAMEDDVRPFLIRVYVATCLVGCAARKIDCTFCPLDMNLNILLIDCH
jgi:hypothetical protein